MFSPSAPFWSLRGTRQWMRGFTAWSGGKRRTATGRSIRRNSRTARIRNTKRSRSAPTMTRAASGIRIFRRSAASAFFGRGKKRGEERSLQGSARGNAAGVRVRLRKPICGIRTCRRTRPLPWSRKCRRLRSGKRERGALPLLPGWSQKARERLLRRRKIF